MISKSEYDPYFSLFVESMESNGNSLIENLAFTQRYFEDVLKDIPEEKHLFSYAPKKWTIQEVIQHIIDTERIFCYRALCFSRGETASLPGFDQDLFVDTSHANDRNYQDLIAEMGVVRNGTIALFESFTETSLKRLGIGSGKQMSVRAAGIIIAGHQYHHINVIKERYL